MKTICKKLLFFIPNSWQKVIESVSEITAQLISDIITTDNEKYFPLFL
jgi:F0F1-type ATP synthase membrane subunit a